MPILKKFIIQQWLRSFLGAFIVLILLISTANLISGLLRSNVTSYEVLINYIIEFPKILNQSMPVSCLFASLFSLNKLKSNSELVAILASGFSTYKIIITIIQISILVASVQLAINSYLQPYLKEKRHTLIKNSEKKFKNLKSKGISSSALGNGKMWYKSTNYYLSFSALDKKNNLLKNISLYYFDENNILNNVINASSLIHKEGNTWSAINGNTLALINSNTEFPTSSKFKEKDFILNEEKNDFLQIDSDITTLNIHALNSYIKRLQKSGINTNEYEIMFYNKFSFSLISVLFSLVACGAIYTPNRRAGKTGTNLVTIFILTLVYWLATSYLTELGKNSIIAPEIASFFVPVLFLSFFLYNLYKNRQLAS